MSTDHVSAKDATTFPHGHGHAMAHSNSATGVTELESKPARNVAPPSPFEGQGLTNLATSNSRILFATDEWFARAECLVKDGPPQFDPDAYCEQGKVMDGWESRRRRDAGHDWCLVQLEQRGEMAHVELDTAHFTGNQAPYVSIEVADITDTNQETALVLNLPGALQRLLHGGGIQGTGHAAKEVEQADKACAAVTWTEVLPKTPLQPGYEATRMHYFSLEVPTVATHVRVNYYPDGGVARLRLWGKAVPSDDSAASRRPAHPPVDADRCTVVPHSHEEQEEAKNLPSRQAFAFPELSSQQEGGQGVCCSNRHYGIPTNLLQPLPAVDMGDGWETARHPERPSILVRNVDTGLIDSPLTDWCILQLGQTTASIERIILDTQHFRGNYPESVMVQGCYIEDDVSNDVFLDGDDAVEWFPLIDRVRMVPDAEHVFDRQQLATAANGRNVSHIKVNIYPDGGIARVRVYGKKAN